jgi:hypothetical protein
MWVGGGFVVRVGGPPGRVAAFVAPSLVLRVVGVDGTATTRSTREEATKRIPR